VNKEDMIFYAEMSIIISFCSTWVVFLPFILYFGFGFIPLLLVTTTIVSFLLFIGFLLIDRFLED